MYKRQVYREYLSDPRPEKMPILEDFYNELRRQDFTVAPIEGADLAEQLSGAIRNIRGTYA